MLETETLELSALPFFHPVMEYLSPEELKRLRAKALVWREVEGEFPSELSWWWEVRLCRRRGDLPYMGETTDARIDSNGVLHCGFCSARWSPSYDGSPFASRCKLCDRRWVSFKHEVPDDVSQFGQEVTRG